MIRKNERNLCQMYIFTLTKNRYGNHARPKMPPFCPVKAVIYYLLYRCDAMPILKGTATLIINMSIIKRAIETVDFDTSFIKIGWKMGKLWAFEYLQTGCNGSGHIIGLLTSHSLFEYA